MTHPILFSGHRPGSAARYSLRTNGPSLELSPHFRLIEFASKDGADDVLVHPALIILLEEVRMHFGKPVTINSGYRSPAHNRAVGGASSSRHVSGMAADIIVKDTSPNRVAQFLGTLKPGGLGRYKTFTHVDVEGINRRWDFR